MREHDPLEEIEFIAAQANKEANGRAKAGKPDHFLARLADPLDEQVETLRNRLHNRIGGDAA